MPKLHIGCGWDGQVFAGTVRADKDGFNVWINKQDCTSDFLATLITLYSNKQVSIGTDDNPNEYTLTLVKNKKEENNCKN